MKKMDRLTLDMSVRQVALGAPGAQRVLEQYPAAKVAGGWSLQDVGHFARAVGREPEALLGELAAAGGVAADAKGSTHVLPGTGGGLTAVRVLMIALAVALTIGGGWGVVLLLATAITGDFKTAGVAWVHTHGVHQLWGWAGLAIFGVAGYLLRQTAVSRPPAWLGAVSRAALLTGLAAFTGALGLSLAGDGVVFAYVVMVASALLLTSAVLFAVETLWSLSGKGLDVAHLFMLAGVQWLLAWAAADVVLRWRFFGELTPPDPGRTLLVQLPVLGFMTNMIFGFGIRLIPGLLNITRPRHRAFLLAVAAYNAGLVGYLFLPTALAWAGAMAMFGGAFLYVAGMRFGRSTQPLRAIAGVDHRGGMLIRVAFFWLLAALGMIVGETLWRLMGTAEVDVMHKYAGAYRHALTVGFITTMIVGVGHRIIPIFLKQHLAMPRVFLVSAVLLMLGNAWRVVFELLTIGEWGWAYGVMGVSGVLELAALVLFGLAMVRTLVASRRGWVPGEPVTASTRVRDLVNAWPGVVEVLEKAGVGALRDLPFVPASMTLGGVVLAEGGDVGRVVGEVGGEGSRGIGE